MKAIVSLPIPEPLTEALRRHDPQATESLKQELLLPERRDRLAGFLLDYCLNPRGSPAPSQIEIRDLHIDTDDGHDRADIEFVESWYKGAMHVSGEATQRAAVDVDVDFQNSQVVLSHETYAERDPKDDI